MDGYDLVNLLIFLACARGLYDFWRRWRSGDLSPWEIKQYLRQLGLLAAVVFLFCLIITGLANAFVPGAISLRAYLRGYLVLLLFLWILWSIGRCRPDPFD